MSIDYDHCKLLDIIEKLLSYLERGDFYCSVSLSSFEIRTIILALIRKTKG